LNIIRFFAQESLDESGISPVVSAKLEREIDPYHVISLLLYVPTRKTAIKNVIQKLNSWIDKERPKLSCQGFSTYHFLLKEVSLSFPIRLMTPVLPIYTACQNGGEESTRIWNIFSKHQQQPKLNDFRKAWAIRVGTKESKFIVQNSLEYWIHSRVDFPSAGLLSHIVNVHRIIAVESNEINEPENLQRNLVKGDYAYYHYLEDGINDNGWGCAYRSLQTLCSWTILNTKSGLPYWSSVPNHWEIQQMLVDMGDKEPNFVNSAQWIGAIEVSMCLNKLYGVRKRFFDFFSLWNSDRL
jgi:hypothetical protein